MKTFSLFLLAALSVSPLLEARGGGRGGGGGGRGGGGANRSPSMSRATTNRPSTAARPQAKAATRSGSMLTSPSNANIQSRLQTQQKVAQGVRNHAGQLPASARNNWLNRANYNPWNYANWAAASGWLGWGGAYPLYYSEGTVYPVETSTVTNPSPTMVSSPPAPTVQSNLPLGIFAITDEKGLTKPTMYIQLALNKEGKLEGSYYNASLNKSYPLTGYITPDTQAAVWKISTIENSPIMETGIYNLTQDQTSAQLFFANGQIQNRLLVRINP